MTQAKKKIILLTTGLILTICLMAFFGVYALTILKNSTFNVEIKYEPEYLVKVEMGIDGVNDETGNQTIEDDEYVEIFNSLNPVSNGMYIDSMSNDTIRINSQTLTPIGENGDVYFKITSLENETSGNKDLKCVIDCGSSTADSGKLVIKTPKILTIATGINATSGTVTSSSLGMIKISLKFSEVLLLDLKYLIGNDATGLDFGEAGKIETNVISGTTFYVSNIDGLLNLSALVGQVDTTTTEYGSNYGYGYDNSAGPLVTFSGATIQMLNDIDCGNKDNFSKTFISIGNSSTNSFQGTFDGNDKTITGLYINQTTNNAGLFGYILDAEIKNLTMQNCKVVSTGYYVGNVVGYANSSFLFNCIVEEAEISGDYYVGGIVGCGYAMEIEIVNKINKVYINGTNYVAGFVGGCEYFCTITIGNVDNLGNIFGNSYIAGIVGWCDKTSISVDNFVNSVDINGFSYVGGLFGYCQNMNVNVFNSSNIGNMSIENNYVGGIIGYRYMGTTLITNCYINGEITFSYSKYVGGVVGFTSNSKTTIINCYNCSNLLSSDAGEFVGGIVGHSSGTVTVANCYNLGETSSGRESDGGIVGEISSGSFGIYNCYYLNTQSFKPIGMGSTLSDSYFGSFDKNQTIRLQQGVLPAELGSSLNLINLLNAWIEDKKETYGNLKNWKQDENNVNNGYPVFMEN